MNTKCTAPESDSSTKKLISRKKFATLTALGGAAALLRSAPQAHAASTIPAYCDSAQTFLEKNTFNKEVLFKAGPWHDVKAYGALGDGSGDDGPEINAAISALPSGGGTVFFPPGNYRITTPIALKSGVNLRGAGDTAACITCIGVGFQWNTRISNVYISDLMIYGASGHVFNPIAPDGGLTYSKFSNCVLITDHAPSAIWYSDHSNGAYLGVTVEQCSLWQRGDSTISAWYLKASGGNLNSNTWRNCTVNGQSAAVEPFFYIENSNDQNYAYDNAFLNVACYQNRGGILRARSVCNLIIEGMSVSMDGSFVSDAILIDRSSTPGKLSRSTTITGYFRRGGTMPSGKYDINTPSSGATDVALINCNHLSSQLALNIAALSNLDSVTTSSPIAALGIKVRENVPEPRMGVATLAAGTKTVFTPAITASSRVLLTSQNDGGTVGFLRISSRTVGTSFTIRSSSSTDTSTVAWLILEPA